MSTVTKWDYRFLALADHIAMWSKDPSTKVGCVLVDSKNRIISLGFNGPPSSTLDAERPREQRLRRTIHAEPNALHFANRDVSGCTAYVTHPPCSHCTAHLIQRGVARIVHRVGGSEFNLRWEDDIGESLEMCKESGTQVLCVGANNDIGD